MNDFEIFSTDIESQLKVDFINAIYPELIFGNEVYTLNYDSTLIDKKTQYKLTKVEQKTLYKKLYNNGLFKKTLKYTFDWNL